MWEMGHSFSSIDGMSLEDIGDILGYWAETKKVENALSKSKGGKHGV